MNGFVLVDHKAGLACPACQGSLIDGPDTTNFCADCGRRFSPVAGLPDLRLESDRYLDLKAERAKAERLHQLEPKSNLQRLADEYYAITDDVLDERRGLFLRHIAGAEARGEVLASLLPRRGRILEVGCGTGGLLVPALRSGRSIEGVDIASRWLVVARRRLSDHGLAGRLWVASAERLPWRDDQFDAVVADSLIEHLDDPAGALREWLRVLRPGGRLILWSPNRYLPGTDPHVGLFGLGWLPRRWLPTYLKLRGREVWIPRTLSATEARRLARAAGFEQVQVDVPRMTRDWARAFSLSRQGALGAYSLVQRWSLGRCLLRTLGPLWELRAVKPSSSGLEEERA